MKLPDGPTLQTSEVIRRVRKKLAEAYGSTVSDHLVRAIIETALRDREAHQARRREDRVRRRIAETQDDEETQKLVANFNAAVIAERERNRKKRPVDPPTKQGS